MMYSVVAYSPSAELNAELLAASPQHNVRIVEGTIADLIDAIRTVRHSALLVPLSGEPHGLQAIRTARDQFPLLAIVAAVRWPRDVPHIVEAVRVGLDDVLAVPGGDFTETISRAISTRVESGTSWRAMSLAAPHVASAAQRLVDTAIRIAHRGPTVSEFAFAVGMSKRTVSRRLLRAGLPQAAELLAWARCLCAAILLENDRATVDSVPRDLRFSSAVALRKTLRRVAGLKPSQVRWPGGAEIVARAITPASNDAVVPTNEKAS